MKLRAHHILCLLAFEGQGYSENFVKTFKNMQQMYFAGEKLEIVCGFDESCLACPNASQNAVCMSETNSVTPEELDSRVITTLSLDKGQETDIFEIADKISVLSHKQLVAICDGCSWLAESGCQQIISRVIKDFLPDNQSA